MPIETPCKKVCVVDPDTNLCRGCGRSLLEIARWTSFSDQDRARVMAELPTRLMGLRARATVATE